MRKGVKGRFHNQVRLSAYASLLERLPFLLH